MRSVNKKWARVAETTGPVALKAVTFSATGTLPMNQAASQPRKTVLSASTNRRTA